MDKNNFRTVRVYTKKYNTKDKDGNVVTKESEQKHVSLKKEDPFEDKELVVVLSADEYNEIINLKSKIDDFTNENTISDYKNKLSKIKNQLDEKDIEITNLKEELNEVKYSLNIKLDTLKEKLLDDKEELIKSKDKLQEVQDKLSEVEEERTYIYKELDYKNKMILAYNVELNKSILKAINMVIDEARDNINKRNLELANHIDKSINQAKIEVNEKNRAIAFEINSTVDALNEEIRNTNLIKMLINKNKINLRVPTSDLLKPFEFNIDSNALLSGQALELDASEIIKEVMPKLPEPFSKFIEVKESKNKTIDVKDKSNDN